MRLSKASKPVPNNWQWLDRGADGTLIECDASAHSVAWSARWRWVPAAPKGPWTMGSTLQRMTTAGKRLRPVVQSVGGVRSLVAWFDSERAEYCQFTLNAAPNGLSYCLPIAPVTAETAPPRYRSWMGMPYADHYYADASCTERVVVYWSPTENGGIPPYALVETEDSCAAASTVVPVLGRGEGAVYERSGAKCVQSDFPRGRVSFLRVGPPLAPTTFVQAHEVVEPRPGPLDAIALRTADGARQVIQAFDRRRSEAVGAGGQRWSPTAVSFGAGLGGGPPACGATATKDRHSARCPISVAVALRGCRLSYYAIRRELPRDEVARCGGSPDHQFFFETGAELPIETFHEVQKTVAGEGRIRSLGRERPFGGATLSESLRCGPRRELLLGPHRRRASLHSRGLGFDSVAGPCVQPAGAQDERMQRERRATSLRRRSVRGYQASKLGAPGRGRAPHRLHEERHFMRALGTRVCGGERAQ